MHVRDGAIVAVGQKLSAPGATVDRRARHDRHAGPGRDALAHVEHAAARHVGREAGLRLLPHDRDARARVRAGRHVPGHAACRRRGDQFRHDLRARLVPQRAQSGIRPRGSARAEGVRAARALLLRPDAGPRPQADDRPRRHREAEERMGAAFQRRPDHARHGVARPRRQPARQRGAGRRMACRIRGRAAARPADLGAFERLEGRARPDRRARARPA